MIPGIKIAERRAGVPGILVKNAAPVAKLVGGFMQRGRSLWEKLTARPQLPNIPRLQHPMAPAQPPITAGKPPVSTTPTQHAGGSTGPPASLTRTQRKFPSAQPAQDAEVRKKMQGYPKQPEASKPATEPTAAASTSVKPEAAEPKATEKAAPVGEEAREDYYTAPMKQPGAMGWLSNLYREHPELMMGAAIGAVGSMGDPDRSMLGGAAQGALTGLMFKGFKPAG